MSCSSTCCTACSTDASSHAAATLGRCRPTARAELHARSRLGAVRVPHLALIAARLLALLRFAKSLRSGRWIASRPSPGGLQHDSVGVKIHVHVHVAVHLSSLMILLGQKRWHRPPRFGNHQAKFTRDRSGGIYSYQMCRTLPLAQGAVLHRAVPPSDAWASMQERTTRGPLCGCRCCYSY